MLTSSEGREIFFLFFQNESKHKLTDRVKNMPFFWGGCNDLQELNELPNHRCNNSFQIKHQVFKIHHLFDMFRQ